MQKKLIALAVAGLIAAPAFAQSNVTIYGIVDMGYRWTGKHVTSGVGSRVGLDSGVMAQSRIGFRGVEDLGNGLKVSFVLERGLAADTGADTNGWNRQAFLALSGDFGTVAFGRQQTPQFNMMVKYDPFADTMDAKASRTYLHNARLDNLAAYVSPNWGGFSFIAGYTQNALTDEPRDTGDNGIQVWAINPNFTYGKLDLSANYHQVKLKAAGIPADGSKVKVWDVMGAYDFDVVRLSLGYGQRKSGDDAGDFAVLAPEYNNGGYGQADKSKQWFVGLSAPIGANGKVMFNYVQRKTDLKNDDSAKVRQYAIGYTHSLSKRTTLYTSYAYYKNNDDAKTNDVYASPLGGSVFGYQRAFNVGIRHAF